MKRKQLVKGSRIIEFSVRYADGREPNPVWKEEQVVEQGDVISEILDEIFENFNNTLRPEEVKREWTSYNFKGKKRITLNKKLC